MKRYIKINNNNLIIDLFLEYQLNKFDGTEIYLDDGIKLKLNGKSISNEYGAYIFEYKNDKIKKRNKSDIDNDPKTLNGILQEEIENIRYKINYKLEDIALDALLSNTEITQEEYDKYKNNRGV